MGLNGGYELMEDYRMHVQFADDKDYQIIQMAMKGLCTAIDHPSVKSTYEKVNSLPHQKQNHMMLDFSVLKEQPDIHHNLTFLQDHIACNHVISFTYQNAQKEISVRYAEPYAIVYKWYAWYLIAYDQKKKEDRIFKVKRMQNLIITSDIIQNRYIDVTSILETIFTQDHREYYDIRVWCKKDCSLLTEEYLNGDCIEQQDNGDYIMSYHLPKDEALWKGVLLGYAGEIEIVYPLEVRELFLKKCSDFIEDHEGDHTIVHNTIA